MNINQVKLYPVWSNFIYFIAGIYSIVVGIYASCNKYKIYDKIIMFFLFGLILIATGTASIIYHLNTPSWTGDPETVETDKYKTTLKIDKGFAITSIIAALLLFSYRMTQIFLQTNLWYVLIITLDPTFILAVLFIILSIIFFVIAKDHNHDAINNCKEQNNKENCFSDSIDAYDIFHSNWHIFTSIAAIFWISFINSTYSLKFSTHVSLYSGC